jgi:hypothetical protein
MRPKLLRFVLFIAIQTVWSPIHSQTDEHQNKPRLQFLAGYGVQALQGNIGSPIDEITRFTYIQNQGGYTFKEERGSRGAGAMFTLNMSWPLKKIPGLSMGIECNALRSSKVLNAERIIDTGFTEYRAKQDSYTQMVSLSPYLEVSTKLGKFRPYISFGPYLPIFGQTWATLDLYDETGTLAETYLPLIDPSLQGLLQETAAFGAGIIIDVKIKAKTTGQLNIGFRSKAGFDFSLSPRIGLLAQVDFIALAVPSSKTTITEATLAGNQAQIELGRALGYTTLKDVYNEADLPMIIREISYQNTLDQNSNSSYSIERRDEALERLSFKDPYHTATFQLGLRYSLGK